MELQAPSEQLDMTRKESIAKFVHDVADMEVRAFTLCEAAQAIREDLNQKENELKTKICKSKEDCEHKKAKYALTQTDYKRLYTSFAKFGLKKFWGRFGVLFGIMVAWVLPCSGIAGINSSNAEAGVRFVLLFVSSWIIGFVILFILLYASYKNGKKKKTEELYTAQEDYKNQMLLLNNQENDLNVFGQETKPETLNRAKELDDAAEEVKRAIGKCYSLDIIKPSYQKLVCVVILDEIFTNDKADTMREANLLCDTELRHGELIGKLDDVIDALNTIASKLDSIHTVLDSIDCNVSAIRKDVNSMKGTMKQIAYATKSVAISSAVTATWCATHW